jgi:hypothetical protein
MRLDGSRRSIIGVAMKDIAAPDPGHATRTERFCHFRVEQQCSVEVSDSALVVLLSK